ncbi:jg17754 [Pararge aegeria aegeria]|uniref:Jg17754 protein n=1 Tax=Pararge aegeria aegeria TaxID=348720 RepID=A0A8S4RQ86_9NEOP|nr:jg17754 [Pararge aegeria aegeria]
MRSCPLRVCGFLNAYSVHAAKLHTKATATKAPTTPPTGDEAWCTSSAGLLAATAAALTAVAALAAGSEFTAPTSTSPLTLANWVATASSGEWGERESRRAPGLDDTGGEGGRPPEGASSDDLDLSSDRR